MGYFVVEFARDTGRRVTTYGNDNARPFLRKTDAMKMLNKLVRADKIMVRSFGLMTVVL